MVKPSPSEQQSVPDLSVRRLDGRLQSAGNCSVKSLRSAWRARCRHFLLTEHDHVYTLGTGAHADHLLTDPKSSEPPGRCRNGSGGDITYHGPGQLVAYPILDLTVHGRDLDRYLRRLEGVVIDVLTRLDVRAFRLPGYTGVWVAGEKICAIGIKASRWVTMHGLALNVTTTSPGSGRSFPAAFSSVA
jgi:lipoyl(octanoyl) transferase